MKNFKVFDCFTFYNELQILHVRFEELYDFVDYFILCEAPLTHRGKQKPLYFDENKKQFSKYSEKIIHLVDNEIPEKVDDPWIRENHQRNYINSGLEEFDLNNNDQIIISDVDEIPNVKTLQNRLPVNWVYSLEQEFYYYNLHNRLRKKWKHSKVLDYETYVNKFNSTPQEVRVVHDYREFLNHRFDRNVIKNGGWHFSYFGGVEKIIDKIENLGHFENDLDEFKNPDYLENAIERNKDIFKSGEKIKKINNIDKNKFPKGIEHLM